MEIKSGIEFLGLGGTWRVIDEKFIEGETLYLLESEQDGKKCPCVVCDKDYLLMHDSILNGWSDYIKE